MLNLDFLNNIGKGVVEEEPGTNTVLAPTNEPKMDSLPKRIPKTPEEKVSTPRLKRNRSQRLINTWGDVAKEQYMGEEPLKQLKRAKGLIVKSEENNLKKQDIDQEINALTRSMRQDEGGRGLGQLDLSGMLMATDAVAGTSLVEKHAAIEKTKQAKIKAHNKPLQERIKALLKQREKVNATDAYDKEILKSVGSSVVGDWSKKSGAIISAGKKITEGWNNFIGNSNAAADEIQPLLRIVEDPSVKRHTLAALAGLFARKAGEKGVLTDRDVKRIQDNFLSDKAAHIIDYILGDVTDAPELTRDNYAMILGIAAQSNVERMESEFNAMVKNINSSRLNRASVDNNFYKTQKATMEQEKSKWKAIFERTKVARRRATQDLRSAQGKAGGSVDQLTKSAEMLRNMKNLNKQLRGGG